MERDRGMLTHRQLEVLELMAKGLTNPEIGEVLGIRLSTVKTHVSAVIEALDVTNRTEAAAALADLCAQAAPDAADRVPGFGERPAIALLPFTRDAGVEDWFAEGLVSDLAQKIGGVRWFPVIDPDSSFAGPPAEELEQAARGLGVRFVVTGHLSREGEGRTLLVQVRDVDDGSPVWAERLAVEGSDLFAAQAETVRTVVKNLEPALLHLERVHRMREEAEEIAIWELCQRATQLLGRETEDEIKRAHGLLEEAARVDPKSARAWAGVANAWNTELYLGFVDDPRAHGQRARDAGKRALDRAPNDAEAHLAFGRACALSLETAQAIPHLERAIELNPSRAQAYKSLAGALRRESRPEEAIPMYLRAARLSPRDPGLYNLHGGLALAHMAAGTYEEAIHWARRSVEEDPEDKPLSMHWLIPAALALSGREEEARRVFDEMRGMPARSLRHSARFTGAEAECLARGLKLAGWDGKIPR